MDDLDDISDEERALSTEFAEALDGSTQPPVEVAELADWGALLSSSEAWSLRDSARRRGRQELLARATARQTGERARAKRPIWWLWLPLPAVLAIGLVYGLGGQGDSQRPSSAAAPRLAEIEQQEDAEGAKSASERARTTTEPGFERPPARYHVGEVPESLLAAQAEVLKATAAGSDASPARQKLQRAMRDYRGQLIASLEAGGL